MGYTEASLERLPLFCFCLSKSYIFIFLSFKSISCYQVLTFLVWVSGGHSVRCVVSDAGKRKRNDQIKGRGCHAHQDARAMPRDQWARRKEKRAFACMRRARRQICQIGILVNALWTGRTVNKVPLNSREVNCAVRRKTLLFTEAFYTIFLANLKLNLGKQSKIIIREY